MLGIQELYNQYTHAVSNPYIMGLVVIYAQTYTGSIACYKHI